MKVTMNYGSSLGNFHLIQWFRPYEAIAYGLFCLLVAKRLFSNHTHFLCVDSTEMNWSPITHFPTRNRKILQLYSIINIGYIGTVYDTRTICIQSRDLRMSLTSFVEFSLRTRVEGFFSWSKSTISRKSRHFSWFIFSTLNTWLGA